MRPGTQNPAPLRTLMTSDRASCGSVSVAQQNQSAFDLWMIICLSAPGFYTCRQKKRVRGNPAW